MDEKLRELVALSRHGLASVFLDRTLAPGDMESEPAKLALPKLKAALTDREYWVRQAAAQAMHRITDVTPHQPALGGFTEPEDHKRLAAANAFLETLGDEDRDLRQAAAEALGRIGDFRAIDALAQALQDPDHWVCVAVAGALDALHWQPADERQRAAQARLLKEIKT